MSDQDAGKGKKGETGKGGGNFEFDKVGGECDHPASAIALPAQINAIKTDDRDIAQIMIDEHRLFESQFDQFGVAAEKRDWELCLHVAREISKGIAVHSWLEEVYLYPTLARHVSSKMQDHGIREHKEMEQKLDKAQQLDPRAGTIEALQFVDLVKEVDGDMRHHMQDEEKNMFPELRKKVAVEELKALGHKAQIARGSAPTHPHPHMPHKGMLAGVAGRFLGAVDRVEDRINKEE